MQSLKFVLSASIASLALGAASLPAHAQGYAGALLMMSNVADGCPLADKCDKRAAGAKVYFGSRLKPEQTLRIGAASLAAVEVSYIRSGVAKASQVVEVDQIDPEFGGVIQVDATAATRVRASALTLAGVVEVPVTSSVVAQLKGGLAYVAATVNGKIGDDSYGSATTNRFSPYLGLGVRVDLTPSIRAVAGFDAFRYKVSSREINDLGSLRQSGVITQLGVGAEASF